MASGDKKQHCSAPDIRHHALPIQLTPLKDRVWFDVEGVDWSVIHTGFSFEIGVPLLQKFREREERRRLRDRISNARKILVDCARSMMWEERRKRFRKKLIKKQAERRMPRDPFMLQLRRLKARYATPKVALNMLFYVFLTMMVFQSSIIVHTFWSDQNAPSTKYLSMR